MGKVKARIRGNRKLYIHNTLENSAFFTKQVIEEKIKNNQRDGIGFDYMNLGIMLAFDFEAKLNFMGARYCRPWNERQRWKQKADHVLKTLGIIPDWNLRPYLSLNKMKTFRDDIAHGKPFEDPIDREEIGEEADIRKGLNLKHPWEDIATHDEIMQAYEDTDKVWYDMIAKSGIEPNCLLDQGEFSVEILQRFDR